MFLPKALQSIYLLALSGFIKNIKSPTTDFFICFLWLLSGLWAGLYVFSPRAQACGRFLIRKKSVCGGDSRRQTLFFSWQKASAHSRSCGENTYIRPHIRAVVQKIKKIKLVGGGGVYLLFLRLEEGL
jgi:hypothetical protein